MIVSDLIMITNIRIINSFVKTAKKSTFAHLLRIVFSLLNISV